MRRACSLVVLAVLVVLAMPEKSPASCTANWTCPNGTTLSCAGQTTCTSAPNYVQCDNQLRKNCPSSSCGKTVICPLPYQRWRLSCFSSTGPCSSTTTSVTCGSTRMTCQQCESGQLLCVKLQDP